ASFAAAAADTSKNIMPPKAATGAGAFTDAAPERAASPLANEASAPGLAAADATVTDPGASSTAMRADEPTSPEALAPTDDPTSPAPVLPTDVPLPVKKPSVTRIEAFATSSTTEAAATDGAAAPAVSDDTPAKRERSKKARARAKPPADNWFNF